MIQRPSSRCNHCGKELDFFDIQEGFSIKKSRIGYGSKHDGDSVDLRLCCECFDKLVKQCEIKPTIEQNERATE